MYRYRPSHASRVVWNYPLSAFLDHLDKLLVYRLDSRIRLAALTLNTYIMNNIEFNPNHKWYRESLEDNTVVQTIGQLSTVIGVNPGSSYGDIVNSVMILQRRHPQHMQIEIQNIITDDRPPMEFEFNTSILREECQTEGVKLIAEIKEIMTLINEKKTIILHLRGLSPSDLQDKITKLLDMIQQ